MTAMEELIHPEWFGVNSCLSEVWVAQLEASAVAAKALVESSLWVRLPPVLSKLHQMTNEAV